MQLGALRGTSRRLDHRKEHRLGRERERPRAHEVHLRELRAPAERQVQRHPGAEAGGRHAQAGVAERVRDAPVQRRAPELAEARAGVDHSCPPVSEAQPLELGQGREEVTGQLGVQVGPVLVLPADAPAAVVERVPAAPQDAPVLSEPVVVEHVAGVRQRLPARPADGPELGLAQRLGHQSVVVHGQDVQAQTAQQRPEGVGGKHDAVRSHHAPRRNQSNAPGHAPERSDGRALEDAHAPVRARARQAPGKARGVEDRRVVVPVAGEIRGRMDLRAEFLSVQPVAAQAGGLRLVVLLAQAVHLPRRGRDLHLAGPLPAAVDGQLAQRALDGVEVLVAELDEPSVLLGEQLGSLRETVRERSHADAAVAAAGLPAGGAGLEDDDVEAGILLLGEQRRPEAGEPGADDGEVAADGAGERRPRGRRLPRVQPERRGSRLSQ